MNINATVAILNNHYEDFITVKSGTVHIMLKLPFLAISIRDDDIIPVFNSKGESVFTGLVGGFSFSSVELIFTILHEVVISATNDSIVTANCFRERTFAAAGTAAKNYSCAK